jgi:hypothetical protein
MKMNSAKLASSVAICLSLVAVITLLGYVSSHAQDPRDFWMINNTGRTISMFYVSQHNQGTWGRNILRDEVLDHESVKIVFNPLTGDSCVMDFALVFRDGTQQVYTQGRNVCRIRGIYFDPTQSRVIE